MRKEDQDKEEIKDVKMEINKKNKKIEWLLREIQDFEEKIADNEKNLEILSKLLESGVIDEDGHPVIKGKDLNDMNI